MKTADSFRDSDCAGFYHWPPLWIGTPPVEQEVDLTPALMNAEVFSSNLVCGVRLKVSKQGLFIFDFAQWEPASATLAKGTLDNWEERVFARMRFMNLFLACFYTSMLRLQRTTSPKLFIDFSTYIPVRLFALGPWHVRSGFPRSTRTTLSENVLQAAVDMTDTAVTKDSNDVAVLAELLLHSFCLYENGRYEASHITAWTIAERCLGELWNTHLRELDNRHTGLEGEGKFVSSERREKLTGRDFTASIISEFLSLSNKLPFDKYKLASRVRQTRNDWLHSLRRIDRTDAAEAISLAQYMLRETGTFDVGLPFDMIVGIPIAWVPE